MEQLEFDLSPCKHPNATKPLYAGGNYGYYGYQKCPDCGCWRDDYTDWQKSYIVTV